MTPEREMEIRARNAFACELAAEGAGPPLDDRELERRDLLAALDAERARANRCERERDALAAQLAALREAALDGAVRIESHLLRNDYAQQGSARRIMEGVLADTATAAEAYTRRVAIAGECRGARLAADVCSSADDIGDGCGAISAALEQIADRIRARADEIERGGR